MATYKFGIRDAKIAPWTATGSYGTAVDLNAVNMIEVTITSTSAQLEGDDVIADVHAINTGADLRIRFAYGAQTMETINVLTGSTIGSSSGSRRILLGDENTQYFGLVAQVYETGGTGDNHLFIPKAKLLDGLSYSASYGAYVVNEISAFGVVDGAAKAFQVIEHPTATSIVIPPVF